MKKRKVHEIPKGGISIFQRKLVLILCLLVNTVLVKTSLSSPVMNVRDSSKTTQKEYLLKGKVLDDKGIPMPGVTVRLDSTTIGVITGNDGAFQLRLTRAKGTLVFSFVGYKTVKTVVEAGKPITVNLKEDVSKLDEVTVIAYGEQSRRNVIGAMSTVKSEDIKDIPSPSLANLL